VEPLHALLDALVEQILARKPLPCRQILAGAKNLDWPTGCREKLRELENLTASYRFPEARKAIDAIRSLLPKTVP
jgi:hypothetical protein